MGCVGSKVESEEGVTQCKARSRCMKQAVTSRHALAAAHLFYVHALKATGSALRQFAEGQEKLSAWGPPIAHHHPAPAPAPSPPPPPPPPPPPATPAATTPAAAKAAAIMEEEQQPKTPLTPNTPSLSQALVQPPPPPPPMPPSPLHDDEENDHVQEFCHMQQHKHEEEGQGLRGLPDLEDGEDDEVDDDDDDEDDDIDGPCPLDSDDAKGVESTTSDRALQALAVTQIAVAPTSANDDGKGIKHNDDHHNMAVTPAAAAAGQVLPRGQGRELLDVLREVDDIFLKAVESSDAVSKFLETRKLPSTYSDGLKGHMRSASILDDNGSFSGSMRSLSNLSSITWNDEGSGGGGSGASGSHVLTLDRLYAWEKKLYNEVKEEEVLRLELEKKYVIFARQEKKGEESTMTQKTKAIIKNLQTRKHVASQAVDAAVVNIQRLRDEELYPQLLELLLMLIAMWKDMRDCHQAQRRALEAMNSIHKGAPAEPTTAFHHQSTLNLEISLFKWGDAFVKVVAMLRNYMRNLNGWLRLSVSFHMSFDDRGNSRNARLTNGFTSPTPLLSPCHKAGTTPIYAFCQQWQSSLDTLPDKDAPEAILNFAAVVRDMARLQEQEFRHRQKAERYKREVEKREAALANARSRDHHQSIIPYSTAEQQGGQQQQQMPEENAIQESAEVVECRIRVDSANRKYTEEKESERKSIQDTRFMTLNSMQTGLSQVFLSMVTFSGATVESFEKLRSFAQNSKISRITDS
ncbi:unnamed protein product [Sphagnum jensenii]|uniref:Uncharacterized protein n=1 Tax=Sphagnum jensenii TaxID=128206 RepID=A0ABP0WZR9_9BRYO